MGRRAIPYTATLDRPGASSSQYPWHCRRMNVEEPSGIHCGFCPISYHETVILSNRSEFRTTAFDAAPFWAAPGYFWCAGAESELRARSRCCNRSPDPGLLKPFYRLPAETPPGFQVVRSLDFILFKISFHVRTGSTSRLFKTCAAVRRFPRLRKTQQNVFGTHVRMI